MKYGWMWAQRGVLRAPEGAEGTGNGGGTETPPAKTTFNINGKEVTPEAAAAAMNLYNSLADPETGKEIIEQLARRTGILKDGDENLTKGDQKKLEGKFTKLMKTKLGKDYDKFSDTLGPVFDEAMESLVAELHDEVKGGSDAATWGSVVEDFYDNNKFTPELESEMQRLIKRNGGRPSGLKGKEAREYLKDFYELAAHKLGLNVKTMRKVSEEDELDPRQDDEDDADEPKRRGRRSRRGDIPEFREVARPKGPLSIDDIVEAASKGIRFRQ